MSTCPDLHRDCFTCNKRGVRDDRYTELKWSWMAITGNIYLTFGLHNNKKHFDWLRKSTVPTFSLSSHSEPGKC
jgi:hypothetical protein